jgi:putative ABC transport system substrate-binding protein
MILELLANKPDILFVAFGAMALIAMKHTKEAPIVFALSSNPEKFGLVASLTRPGRNVTGVSTREQELLGKRIELMREIAPGIRRIATLANPDSPDISKAYLENYSTNARNFGIEVKAYDARSVEDFRPAFDRMRSDQMQGLLNIADTFQFRVRNELVANAARLRLPAIYTINGFVEAGGLASFGTNLSEQFRRAAEYVDKILRGTKPADLPVQEPTRFQLAVNLKAAREQDIKIPSSILVRADQVIE